jgi:PAS domain S-box-containing protein
VNTPGRATPVRKPVRILVVEDSEDDTEIVVLTLRRGGFEPAYRRVQDIEAFRAALHDERWDAVLSDFRMPGFSGVDALHAFRALGLDVPFIFVSGTIGEEIAVEAMKAGASDFVMKQNLARLSPVLERELAQAAIRAERRQAQVEFEAARQRAEQSIRESQRLLQAIVDNSAAVIYLKDLQGRYLLVNRCFGELLQRSQADILGKTDHELFPAEVAQAFRAADELVARLGSALTAEEAPRGGERRTFLSVKCPLHDEQGKLTGVFGISTDITDRKHAQARLQAQFERLQLLDHITSAIGERQDLQSIYQVAISSLEEQLPADFACMCSHDPIAQTLTVSRVGPRTLALAPSMALTEQALIAVDENGLARCVGGELVYEPDVRASTFPFPQRLAQAGLGALVAIPLTSERRVLGVLLVARKQPDSFSSGECEFLRQLSAHVALAAQQAELRESLQLAYDDLRRSQETVMQQDRLRALGQMASGIAHDVNNAISPVLLYAEHLLDSERSLSPRGRAALETIARAIDDVAATVARMREFYRQRETRDEQRPLRLNALVQQVLELTQARWSDMPQQHGAVIRLETALATELPDVRGVDSELREALVNLVFNAVDAMPEGGVLTLRTQLLDSRQDDGEGVRRHVTVEVEDTGVGMDEPTRRRCLEPFFTAKGERGTGLGLAMVYGIAQRHGAKVAIDSAPGRGTRVRLEFPVEEFAPQLPEHADPPTLPRPDAGLRILLIDDDPLIIRSLSDTLVHDGHEVVTAGGGGAGIEAFTHAHEAGRDFQLVITDLGMPHVDGRRVAAAIKGLRPSVPILLLTGWGRRLVADGEVPAHVDLVLSKPPKLQELRTALAQLARKQASRGVP